MKYGSAVIKELKRNVKYKLNYDGLLYDIPNVENVKLFSTKDSLSLAGFDSRGLWFALGDRNDLKPDCLKDFGLTSLYSTDVKDRDEFVKRVVKVFA